MGTANAITEASQLLDEFAKNKNQIEALDKVANLIAEAFQKGGHLYAMGNGGSLADAAHFAEELSGKFSIARPPLPAIALTDAAHLTCVANDFGFEMVFARLITAFAKPGDIVLLLTTSGNSQNLIEAAKSARQNQATVVSFTGRGGGKLAELTDLLIDFPGATSDRIQELQMLALHAITGEIERLLGFTA